ncbi:MAG: RimK/LysX family protein, partial [Pseudomonas marincola]
MQVARCIRFALIALGIGSVFPALAGEAQSKTFGWIEEAIIEPEAITVKAKLDTGAKTSSMDAKDLETFKKDGEDWV